MSIMINITARVESPNTVESDNQAKVWHLVGFDDVEGRRQCFRRMVETTDLLAENLSGVMTAVWFCTDLTDTLK